MYKNLETANNSDKEMFTNYLKIHQQGEQITTLSAGIVQRPASKDSLHLLTK
ncbi:MAG: hypothetical protein ABI374_12375 [Ginsengibacter sp.]